MLQKEEREIWPHIQRRPYSPRRTKLSCKRQFLNEESVGVEVASSEVYGVALLPEGHSNVSFIAKEASSRVSPHSSGGGRRMAVPYRSDQGDDRDKQGLEKNHTG